MERDAAGQGSGRGFKGFLALLLKLGLAGACLVYAFWDVDPARLISAFGRYSPLRIAAALGCVLLILAPPGLRLMGLCRGEAGFGASLSAVVLGLGVNNILPARMGEVAKAVYLRRAAGMTLARGMVAVFWERFLDLNALLFMALCAALLMDLGLAVYPLLAVVLGLWLFVVLNRVRPGAVAWLVHRLPGERLRLLASEVLMVLGERLGLRLGLALVLQTVLVWLVYAAMTVLVLWWVAGLGLSLPELLTIFIAGTLGLALPSSPGGLGVYEAAVVASLGWFGVAKTEALAAALVLHMVQYLPTTLWAVGIMVRTGLGPRQLGRD
ncbi:MAG: lysylphosphatidylglycerol synthase transmembrane domain-containing protein [Desulfovibrionaceae bacterium]|nr:lysylphosphatidylglycerol synthase transmembrane domain-containing protein [Desulfovibrionaceae bacterium]